MKGKSRLVGLLIVACMAMAYASTALAAAYDHEIKVQKMEFAWKIEGPSLLIKLTAPTKGWVGIGFNPSHEMKDARFILGYIKEGKAVVTDEYGTGDSQHEPIDTVGGKSEVTLVGGQETGDMTTIEFSIPLVPADGKGKSIDPTVMTPVLLAYGPDIDSFKIKHKFRTKINVDLSTGKSN